jgi:hypothetical protein
MSLSSEDLAKIEVATWPIYAQVIAAKRVNDFSGESIFHVDNAGVLTYNRRTSQAKVSCTMPNLGPG